MRPIAATLFMTLDGVVESPHEWHFPFFSDEMGEVMSAGMADQHAYLIGRTLYDEWAQYWPQHVDDDPFGRYISDVDKYVLTHRDLGDEPWTGSTALGDDPVARVTELKDQGDGRIGVTGSASTVQWLLANSLLDELNLLVDPVVVGRGKRLFDGAQPMTLELTHSTQLPKGVLHLRYSPAGEPANEPVTERPDGSADEQARG
jgi:dihydrofolate reductase